MFKSPKSYNEMLPKLNLATAVGTFGYVFVLASFGYIPRIDVNHHALMPPLDPGYARFTEWALSFGVVPFGSAVIAYVLSSSFEMHNILSKLLGLRYFWDRFYIVRPLRERANSDVPLNRAVVRRVMTEFYYKQIKTLDSHFVELFWRYAMQFWVIFEHAVIVAASIFILWLMQRRGLQGPVWYLGGVVAFGMAQFFLVTVRKTGDEIKQISTQSIVEYFKVLSPIARL
jgi:hypothetical protein